MPDEVGCMVCGSRQSTPREDYARLLMIQSPYGVRRCLDCGMVYLSPRPTVDELDVLYHSEKYYAADNAFRGAARLAFYRRRMRHLERTAPKGRLLGIACLEGGYQFGVAQERGWDVEVVEFSTILARHAEKHAGVKVHHARAWDLEGVAGNFDAVFTQSPEHLPDFRRILRQCRERLKPGGILHMEAPNEIHSLKQYFKLLALRWFGSRAVRWFRQPVDLHFHLYFFAADILKRVLQEEGFEILSLRTHRFAHPLYLGRGYRRWLREPIYFLGSLFGAGPFLEVFSRRRADRAAT